MQAAFEDADDLNIDLKIVQFEQLLLQPEVVLRSVCEFVGLDFRPSMMPPKPSAP